MSSEDSEPLSKGVQNLLGIIIIVHIIILIITLPFMGFSSLATEPNPIFGKFFSAWVLLILIVIGISFFISSEKIQKRDKNGSKT